MSSQLEPAKLIHQKISELNGAMNTEDILGYLDDIANIGYENGIQYSNSGQYDKASEVYELIATAHYKVLDMISSSTNNLRKPKSSYQYLRESARYWEKQAKATCREGSSRYASEGRKLMSLGNYNESITSFKKALKLEPSADTWIDIGNAYFYLEDFSNAKQSYEEAKKLNKDNAYAWSYLGLALEKLKNHEEAIKCFEKAISINPNDALFFTYLGKTYLSLGRYHDAESSFTKAIQINPKNWEALNSLGTIYTDEFFDYNKAKEYYQFALNFNSNSVLVKINLAEVLLILKEYDKSENLLKEVRNVSYDQTFSFVIRFLSLCLFYLRGFTQQGHREAIELFNYYKSIPVNYKVDWTFNGLKKMIKDLEDSDNRLSKEVNELILFITSLSKVNTENDKAVALEKLKSLIEKTQRPTLSRLRERLKLSQREDYSLVFPASEDIEIVNSSYADITKEGWYDWEVHLSAPEDVLANIDNVKYILHPSFNPPDYTIRDSSDFKLSAKGWGEFMIKIIITFKNKQAITKYHWLKLAGGTPLDK